MGKTTRFKEAAKAGYPTVRSFLIIYYRQEALMNACEGSDFILFFTDH